MTRSDPTAISCDEAVLALALEHSAGAPGGDTGRSPPVAPRALAAALVHVQGCFACRADEDRARTVARALSGDVAPEPSPAGQARILAAAAPHLARNAARTRAERRRVAWALTVALLPLPLIVFANVKLLLAAHLALSGVLDPRLSLYLVGCLGAGVALLLALSYLAVPLLARRLARPRLPWSFVPEETDVHAVA